MLLYTLWKSRTGPPGASPAGRLSPSACSLPPPAPTMAPGTSSASSRASLRLPKILPGSTRRFRAGTISCSTTGPQQRTSSISRCSSRSRRTGWITWPCKADGAGHTLHGSRRRYAARSPDQQVGFGWDLHVLGQGAAVARRKPPGLHLALLRELRSPRRSKTRQASGTAATRAVWHFDSDLQDSTSNGNVGTNSGAALVDGRDRKGSGFRRHRLRHHGGRQREPADHREPDSRGLGETPQHRLSVHGRQVRLCRGRSVVPAGLRLSGNELPGARPVRGRVGVRRPATPAASCSTRLQRCSTPGCTSRLFSARITCAST